jgi:uncharacterized tellurite resistance protein B-like protein
MLKALTGFFEDRLGSDAAGDSVSKEQELRLATAVLLVEVARADFSEDDVETEAVADLLKQHLDVPGRDVMRSTLGGTWATASMAPKAMARRTSCR